MTALKEVQTPLNNKLGEACAMLKNLYSKAELVKVLEDETQKLVKNALKQRKFKGVKSSIIEGSETSVLYDIPSPKNSTRESSRYFMENLTPSPSVKDNNWEKIAVFPSLAGKLLIRDNVFNVDFYLKAYSVF